MYTQTCGMGAIAIKPATRCNADRETDFVTSAMACNVIDAAMFAAAIGLPLNRFVTINWNTGGSVGGTTTIMRFLKLVGDWLACRSLPRVWVWVREPGKNGGEHIHVAMHVPPAIGAEFGRQQMTWLKECGAMRAKGVIHTRPVGRNANHAFNGLSFGEHYLDNLKRAVEYILKGVSQHTALELGLPRFSEAGGRIVGKRAGTSANIGAKARVREGFIVAPSTGALRGPYPE